MTTQVVFECIVNFIAILSNITVSNGIKCDVVFNEYRIGDMDNEAALVRITNYILSYHWASNIVWEVEMDRLCKEKINGLIKISWYHTQVDRNKEEEMNLRIVQEYPVGQSGWSPLPPVSV